MEEHKPSTTALATARMRSIHTSDDPQPIISDPWGSRFASASTLAVSLLGEEFNSKDENLAKESVDAFLRGSPAYANVISRSCYTESTLKSLLAEGVSQYVIVGAGYDSYALRRPAEAADLEIFEIDHPSTQSMKKQKLTEFVVPKDDRLHFISADLGEETVESALSRSPYKSTEQAFLSWLGVTMYLSREANMATLQSIAHYCAPGSLLVFTYVDQAMFEGNSSDDAEAFAELEESVKSVGEPFVSGFHPDKLEMELRSIGLALEENMDDSQVLERFDPSGTSGLSPGSKSYIARARVVGKPGTDH